ncbi:MAG TPA: bifunctional (p)ppGpp synthetase/guanosine-3',5'-bis(diphosphate) 3'-pyrophosphohydrolase, partial [Peptostreptococcaceae bacterium]|nr:bifunctional (p)ppGpp synthetase/guanosine-3',5'-bis(diphosphate) 3'-pyrophosphohydrolase [Peptostreptococcaceae bacterium]
EDIEKKFGKEVANLVDGVTKLGQIKYQSKEETQAENLRKMFLAMAKDIRVVLIKLSDRLHNMRTLKFMPPEKAKEKAKETLEIYGGIAHRLGIYKIKWELEDLALRYIDPEGYYDLVDKISKKRSHREAYITKVVEILNKKFNEVSIVCEVSGRPKHFYSIYNKMHTKYKSFEEIYDLMAVRVLVDSVKDCYAVLGMVHTLWKPIPGRFKDYIAMPKPNMYQSLHTTVIGPDGEPVEIQIRTADMHKIAEYGIAAHWKYKEEKVPKKQATLDEKLYWLRQMMEWEKDLKDPHEFMDALKEDVFNSQVYVFSPKGDVIELPAGSGPIDFAYRVHTNVGNNCVGAKVDGRIVPLDYKLQNGNIIEILTSSNSNGPSRDWLNVAKTPNAKSKIRQWFKKERREDNIERGKGTLERELKRQGFNPNEVLIEKYMSVITKKFNQPTTDDLYATIGYGGIIASQVLGKVKELYEKDNIKKLPEQPAIKSLTEQEYKKKRKVNSQGVVVKGVDNILVRFAKCCNPLPGDEIVGYITKGRGVAVHRLDCPNTMIENTDFKDRIIEVEWNIAKAVKFEAEIQIRAIDKKGIISEITHLIANDKMGLSGINARTSKDRTVNINLLLEVDDINELNSLMNKLKNMQGIEDVYRVIN